MEASSVELDIDWQVTVFGEQICMSFKFLELGSVGSERILWHNWTMNGEDSKILKDVKVIWTKNIREIAIWGEWQSLEVSVLGQKTYGGGGEERWIARPQRL